MLFLCFALSGSLIRLSRPDFGLLPALAPFDFHGTSTNFIVCAGTPLLALCFNLVIGLSDYVKMTVTTAVGLSIYEVVQIWLPRRTFDPYDIVASFLGAILSILLAAILFLMRRKNEKIVEDRAARDGGSHSA